MTRSTPDQTKDPRYWRDLILTNAVAAIGWVAFELSGTAIGLIFLIPATIVFIRSMLRHFPELGWSEWDHSGLVPEPGNLNTAWFRQIPFFVVYAFYVTAIVNSATEWWRWLAFVIALGGGAIHLFVTRKRS